MRPRLRRVGRLQPGSGTAAARREIGTRQPPDASKQCQQNRRRTRGLGPRLDLEDAAARERGRELTALDCGERAMWHSWINIFGAARFRRCELTADHAEAGVVDGVGRNYRGTECSADAMVACTIRNLGDEVEAVETRVERRRGNAAQAPAFRRARMPARR